jgi:hypothetical protein
VGPNKLFEIRFYLKIAFYEALCVVTNVFLSSTLLRLDFSPPFIWCVFYRRIGPPNPYRGESGVLNGLFSIFFADYALKAFPEICASLSTSPSLIFINAY